MKDLNKLYDIADNGNIKVYNYRMTGTGLSAATIRISDKMGIFLDYKQISTVAEEKVLLSHELGHCETGAVHKIYSPYYLKERDEYQADKWAVHQLIPLNELKRAIKNGYTEMWELAEHFNVTEEFMNTVYQVYKNEGYPN